MFYALVAFVALVAGTLIGLALANWRSEKAQRESRRIPRQWPLVLRPLVNSNERRVWAWLAKVMFDQHILIKMPVTRFTAPASAEQAAHWYKLLNGVYCTFTVCGMDGRVVGCVDVPTRAGLSMSNQTLKHGLLSQCGVRYWVVDPENLPHLAQLREAFLGEHAARVAEREFPESRMVDTPDPQRGSAPRKRQPQPMPQYGSESVIDVTVSETDEQMLPDWEQNSFMTPLDSRVGGLNR
jgi:hypothetical protein